MKVRINNTCSSIKEVKEETPQGSTLSCTLFLMAINEISSSLPDGVYGTLYVDDYEICVTARRSPLLERKLQSAINGQNEWAKANRFQFSTAVFLHVCRICGWTKASPQLRLNNTEISHRDHY